MSELIIKKKKSAVVAQSAYDFKQLTRENPYLLNLKIEKLEDYYAFEFDNDGYNDSNIIKSASLLDKYRFLLNCLKLSELYNSLNIDLNPNNLYVDYNYSIKVAYRDVYSREDLTNEDKFIHKYLCLLGFVLQDKYDYQTFEESGISLLGKNKLTKEFVNVSSITQISEILLENYKKEQEHCKKDLIQVNKSKYKRLLWGSRILLLILIAAVSMLGFYKFYEQPHNEKITAAYESYVVNDYVATIKNLNTTSVSRLNKTTKYILTLSYIRSDALTDEQKANILNGIVVATDEKILDFWVYLSKNDFDEAIDIAKQLGNNEYQIYGYMKQKKAIENDTTISGSEREEKTNEINQKLSEFELDEEDGL